MGKDIVCWIISMRWSIHEIGNKIFRKKQRYISEKYEVTILIPTI